jgi:hypothetical protein
MVRVQAVTVFLLALCAASASNLGEAQEPSDKAEARALFEEGVGLAEENRWTEALEAFQSSNELVSRASTSYNIANALYRLNRPVDALAELDEHDRMPATLRSKSAQKRSRELRALVRESVAEVMLSVSPASATILVDGWPSTLAGSERLLLLNPGNHFIEARRDGYHPLRQELVVERGSKQLMVLQLEPIDLAGAEPPPSAAKASLTTVGANEATAADDRKPFVKRPGFWVLIGVVGAAAIGAGVAVAVTRRDDAPACGTTGDCATTQGLSFGF